jgi:homoserine O-acetyltransferase
MRYALVLFAVSLSQAAEYPQPVEADWAAPTFRFHNGQSLENLRMHYTTVGARTGQPVILLHGTGGNGRNFLTPQFAGEMFGAGQPLDASRYFIILPDSIGAGKSAKPSDGLGAKFPEYNYADLVAGTYRLVKEGLGIAHVSVVLGNSMGGMETWMFGEMYPDFMDVLVPMASEPSAMGGRNWLMRRMVIEAIRKDPENFRSAQVFYNIATSGGALALYNRMPNSAAADKDLERQLAQPGGGDANDVLYMMQASRDYDPAPGLEKIKSRVLAINSADDERNPPELGVMEQAMKRIPDGRYVLIPIGPETRGHGTTGGAKLWKKYLAEFLAHS